MMTERERFEAWITAPPIEKSVERNPEDGQHWPGQYRDYTVQLAWEGWRAALEQQRKLNGPAITKLVDEYVDGYTLEGDEGYYSPTERELLLIRDACHGLSSELLAAAPEPDDE